MHGCSGHSSRRGDVPQKHGKLARRRIFDTEQWGNQVDSWPIKLTDYKGEIYPTIYQELACIGSKPIDRELDMFPPNLKNSPKGEFLTQNYGRTRWISGQQS
jgi:hypothetical protein